MNSAEKRRRERFEVQLVARSVRPQVVDTAKATPRRKADESFFRFDVAGRPGFKRYREMGEDNDNHNEQFDLPPGASVDPASDLGMLVHILADGCEVLPPAWPGFWFNRSI